MSAFIVSKTHIDVLVQAALRVQYAPMTWYHGNPMQTTTVDYYNADLIGQMLWNENYHSVNYRYSETELAPGYSFTASSTPLDPIMVLKQIACYEYQSCEHPGWEASSAKAFCDTLTKHMINLLPGYDDAPWGIADAS